MAKFAGPHNATNLGKVPKVAQVFWSRKRSYHGEEVKLSVRTEGIADGVAAELRISTKGGGAVVDTITGVSIKSSKIDHAYKIDWKNKAIPAGVVEFVFQAVIGKVVSGASPILFVDLEPPALSA
jgi:hypothetical protein